MTMTGTVTILPVAHTITGSGPITIAAPIMQTITIGDLVSIAPDGKITYGANYTPDAAAKQFWNAMGHRRAVTEAAADMLAALQEIVAHVSDPANAHHQLGAFALGQRIADARTAIAKATGSVP